MIGRESQDKGQNDQESEFITKRVGDVDIGMGRSSWKCSVSY